MKDWNEFRLFAHGKAFDVDAFLESSTLRPDYVWRLGDRRKNSCFESHHPTSGLEFALGGGQVVQSREQEVIAVAFFEQHRDELRALARFPGADTFILGLPYHTAFDNSTVGFALGPSLWFMWHCVNVGVTPLYYVSLEHSSDSEFEDDDSCPPLGCE